MLYRNEMSGVENVKHTTAHFIRILQGKNNQNIIQTLHDIKKMSRKENTVSDQIFVQLIELLGTPNCSLLDANLSIIANCCIKEHFRTLFIKNNGIKSLMLLNNILLTSSVASRVSRLIGNLADNSEAARMLSDGGAHVLLLQCLKNKEYSDEAVSMSLRAIIKLWKHQNCRTFSILQDYVENLTIPLERDDPQIQKTTLHALTYILSHHPAGKQHIEIKKSLLIKLVDISKNERLTSNCIECLNVIMGKYFQNVSQLLEGAGVAEVYISFMRNKIEIDFGTMRAFRNLCREGGIRAKVKESDLLSHLVSICDDNNNISKILGILYTFQFDDASMKILARQDKFINMLTDNLCTQSINLMYSILQLPDPAYSLLSDTNLSRLISSSGCNGVLKQLVSNNSYLPRVIQSGKVSEFVKCGCNMENVTNGGCGEGLIVHLLVTGDLQSKENTALAVPFLVQSRNFKLLYKLLARHHVLDTILKLFQERPLDEKVLASVVRLVNIARTTNKSAPANLDLNNDYFKHFIDSNNKIKTERQTVWRRKNRDTSNINTDKRVKNKEQSKCIKIEDGERVKTSEERVEEVEVDEDEVFEDEDSLSYHIQGCEDSNICESTEPIDLLIDDGSVVTVDKNLLCRCSPVFEAMFNGYFMEASQATVKFSSCTRTALLYLVQCLKENCRISTGIPIDVHLELLSLTERYMMPLLNNQLTSSLVLNESNCIHVYDWLQHAGHTHNFAIIRRKSYEFLFNDEKHLLIIMKNEQLREKLMSEIICNLKHFLRDLL